ncbi:MAG: hypothetical protein K8L91_13890 [Anaerolineae bacterium]|nr:hypothetical protein [Anaerolineae bacterium]
MTDQSTLFSDVILNPSGEPVKQYEIQHGRLRTLLYSSKPDDMSAQLRVRYDEKQLVFAFGQGVEAVALTEQTVEWLWHSFPQKNADAGEFSESFYTYLQHEARSIGKGDSTHAMIIGALTREIPEGRIWLSWLGTSGLRVLNHRRTPLSLDEGLFPGEGWSPANGVSPDRIRPHAQVFSIHYVERLLIFSSPLRPLIDELPFMGNVALQRVAEAHTQTLPAILMDIRLYRVNPDPGDVTLQYRWENFSQAVLSWTNSPRATGYRIEQSSSPTFNEPVIVADMTDARQRVHNVQPPSVGETYYRVIPYSQNMPGKPSNPIMITPVQLVPPILQPIEWGQHGFVVTWSKVNQANLYEVEASPDSEFDSSQTMTFYRGTDTTFETEDIQPSGWYFRVRSANSVFAPRSPSQWSNDVQAPKRLHVPYFESVTLARIVWTPVRGAQLYEVRQQSGENNKNQKIHTVEGRNFFEPAKQRPSIYQVRALHRPGDDLTASNWTELVVVNTWLEGERATGRIPIAPPPIEMEDTADALETVETGEPDEDTLELRRKDQMSRTYRRLAIGTAGVGAAGILVLLGLIGGPRLGIGLDPTATPLTRADREATGTQVIINQENATALAELNQQIGRIVSLGTESAFRANQLATRNSNLIEENMGNTVLLDSIYQTATAQANEQANAQATYAADYNGLMATATVQAINVEAEQTQSAATATFAVEFMATYNAQAMTQVAGDYQATIDALEFAMTPTSGLPVQRFGKTFGFQSLLDWWRQLWP